METITQAKPLVETTNGCTRFTSTYLNKNARELRRKARKIARASGFEPRFEDDFVLVYNESKAFLSLQIHYTVNGSNQVDGLAI